MNVGNRARPPLPEIDRFPVHYYEDGIEGFTTALRLRQIVALKHWQGETGFTMFDAIQKMTGPIR